MAPTRSQVYQKINRYWPDTDPEEIMKILDQYGVEKYEGGRNRVHLAIIKVSEGELSRLPELVKVAKADYRDVLAWAEYPRQIKIGFVGMKRLSPDEAEAIRREDREQYLQWLEE